MDRGSAISIYREAPSALECALLIDDRFLVDRSIIYSECECECECAYISMGGGGTHRLVTGDKRLD